MGSLIAWGVAAASLGLVLVVWGALTASALLAIGVVLVVLGAALAIFGGLSIVSDARGQSPAKPPLALARGLRGYFRARRLRRIAELLIRARSVDGRSMLEADLDHPGAGSIARILLARVVLLQNQRPGDHARVVELYRSVIDRLGIGALPQEDQRYYVEALLGESSHDEARAIIATWTGRSPVEHRLAADSVNPFAAGGAAGGVEPAAIEQWLSEVNRGITPGVEPIGVRAGGEAPLDRVVVASVTPIESPARVTVVISSWRPDRTLFTAVESALASSWSNLEVLVVDDASGPGFDDLYAELEALDSRVVVRRLDENGGTYGIRNVALDVATGEFLTFQDSDDWMHPRRLETQANHLLANPALPANATTSVRVTPNMQFSNNRSPNAKICEPSLMIRREAVVARIGYFDHVRKNGDVEYRKRIESAFGAQPVVLGGAPLTLQRVSDDSLSNREVGREWVNPARRAYMNAFRYWHLDATTNHTALVVPADATPERPFFAPPELLGTKASARFDIIVVSNWLETGDGPNALEDELDAAASRCRVAIVHSPLFTLRGARPTTMSRRVAELLRTGRIELVQLDTESSAPRLFVSSTAVLPLLDSHASAISADLVVVRGDAEGQDDTMLFGSRTVFSPTATIAG